jgi:hypothetical protein
LAALDPAVLATAAEHLRTHDALRTRLWLDLSYPPELSVAILDCVATQAHFAAKFTQADRWLLTRQAAEQATPSLLAAWRSDYLKSRFPAAQHLSELGTGLGGDSVYLARNFDLLGYEQDPARAILAQENLARLSPQASAAIECRQIQVGETRPGCLFADPARRGPTRKFDPESWEPPLSSLLAIADRLEGLVVKTAPGLDLSLVRPEMEVHFLSLGGELKEAMLLSSGGEVGPSRHAWLWERGSESPLHRCGEASPAPVRPPAVGEFLHNPDPAVVRSGLLHSLAEELRAGVVHPKIGYLCGPLPSPDGWATSFRILESQPLRWKSLNASLMAMSWSEIEYLARGVPFSQEEVLSRTKASRKSMKGRSGGRGAVVIYRDNDGYWALLAQRESLPKTGQGKPGDGGKALP